MNVVLGVIIFSLLLPDDPIYGQSLCADCLKFAQDQRQQCLENAISVEDKTSCQEKQQTRAKACENGECKIERAQRQMRNDVLPQKQSPIEPLSAAPAPAAEHEPVR